MKIVLCTNVTDMYDGLDQDDTQSVYSQTSHHSGASDQIIQSPDYQRPASQASVLSALSAHSGQAPHSDRDRASLRSQPSLDSQTSLKSGASMGSARSVQSHASQMSQHSLKSEHSAKSQRSLHSNASGRSVTSVKSKDSNRSEDAHGIKHMQSQESMRKSQVSVVSRDKASVSFGARNAPLLASGSGISVHSQSSQRYRASPAHTREPQASLQSQQSHGWQIYLYITPRFPSMCIVPVLINRKMNSAAAFFVVMLEYM